MTTTEYIDILNADGSPTGKKISKPDIHTQGHYHNTAHVWFYNSNSDILLARRSASKAIYPLLWDVSVAGHVDSGETITQAAVRETREEIGIEISEGLLEKIGVYTCFQSYPNGIKDNEFHHTYIARIDYDPNDFNLDINEVEQVKFVSISQFRELLENSDTNGHFISSNTLYYLEVIEAIQHRLTT